MKTNGRTMEEWKMRIINMIENTSGHQKCLFEHGLSFYIETHHHKLLVDTGASDAFLENAKILNIDLMKVDTVILSHGHYDHAGGIMAFSRVNPNAEIYMHKQAGDAYYHKSKTVEKYIGIDPAILSLPQLRKIEGNYIIDEELSIFTGVTGRTLWPEGNQILKVKKNHQFIQDQFDHEQYLVLTEGKKYILVSGCAHNGILNILDRFYEIYGTNPDIVISGFHMMKKRYTDTDKVLIRQTAERLRHTKTIFYTGHCTGELPYQILKEQMGDQIIYIHSGDQIIIPDHE